MKTRTTRLWLAVLLMGAAVASAGADFSGTWVLDKARSEGLPEGIDQTMTVKQAGDRVEVETRMTGPMGEQTIPDLYVLDGKETDFTPPVIGGGGGKGRRTARWTADGNGFESTEQATLDGPEGKAEIKGARKWTLAGDGRTLTIEMTLTTSQGDVRTRRIFARK